MRHRRRNAKENPVGLLLALLAGAAVIGTGVYLATRPATTPAPGPAPTPLNPSQAPTTSPQANATGAAIQQAAAAALATMTPGSPGYACQQARFYQGVLMVTGETMSGTSLDSTTAKSWADQCIASGGTYT
jgi:hypothetical protein